MKEISLLSKKYICLLCTKNWDMDKKKSDYSHKKERKQGKRNMDVIVQVNDAVNSFVWGVPAMVCIIGVALFLLSGTVLKLVKQNEQKHKK